MLEQGDSTAPDPTALARSSCLDVDELVAMTEGALPPERVDQIVVHVDGCESCAEVIANLGALGDRRRVEIGRYQLANVLGAGGMGIVYEAWDPQLRRKVALKLVRPEHADAESHSRMLREARALARVSHPNVVTVYEVTEDGGQICVATELVDGETLSSWQSGRSADAIIDAWLQAARGLAAAHSVGVVHRDVKPTNVLVGRDGRVRVGDFGLARLGDDASIEPKAISSPATDATLISAMGTVAGTPAYMSPEQAEGRVDARSDQYALCVSLAEALTGVWPGPDSVPAIDRPAGLRDVLARGLRTDPSERFHTMDAFVDAIEHVMTPRRRRWPFVVAGGLGALAIGGIAVWALHEPARSCEIATVPTEIWSPERRARIVASGGEHVAARVDTYLATWSEASADVCAVDRDDDALRARRRECLDDELHSLDHRLARLEPGAGPRLERIMAHAMLEDLSLPSECSRSYLSEEPDPTPEQARWRDTLAQVDQNDRAQLQRWWEQSKRIGFVPYVVEAADMLATLESRITPPINSDAILREAITIADAGSSDVAWIHASMRYLMTIGDRPDEALKIGEAIRNRLDKKGVGRNIEGRLELAIAQACSVHRLHDRVAALQRAHVAFRTAYGPNSVSEAISWLNLSAAQQQLDETSEDAVASWNAAMAIYDHLGLPRPPEVHSAVSNEDRIASAQRTLDAELAKDPRSRQTSDAENVVAASYAIADQLQHALEHYQRAVEIRDRLGIRDNSYATDVAQIANMLSRLQRPREAIPFARRAVDLATSLKLDGDLTSALTTLGRALVDAHDESAAREPLERAMHLRDRNRDPERARAVTLYELARATWPTDRAKARAYATLAGVLADNALAALGSTKIEESERSGLVTLADKIKRWTEAHR